MKKWLLAGLLVLVGTAARADSFTGTASTTSVVSVSTQSATALVSADKNRVGLILHSADLALNTFIGGGSDVSTSNGFTLHTSTHPHGTLDLGAYVGALWAIGQSDASDGPVNVEVIEITKPGLPSE